jgi:hypothetical protein
VTRLLKVTGPPAAPPAGRTVETEWQHNGRRVVAGTELSVRGQRGRFRFVAHVTTTAGAEWIDVYGGPDGRAMFRSFAPDKITRVHRTTKARTT